MKTKQEMEGMTNAQLVAVYNAIPGVKPLTGWKGKKEVLLARIAAAQPAKEPEPTIAHDEVAATNATPKAKRVRKKKDGEAKPRDVGKVRALCEQLLTEVAYHEDRTEPPSPENRVKEGSKEARSVGLSFGEILGKVKAKLGTETSYACLRWYAVHLRHRQVELPSRRPKSSWK